MINRNAPISARIQWETFEVVDNFRATMDVNIRALQTSEEMIELILSNYRYRMYRYASETNSKDFKIGYGFGNPNLPYGMTEDEAYSEWLKEFKIVEKNFVRQLPINFMTQSQFDALISLYFTTGKWKTVESNTVTGTYDILGAIKLGNWEAVANMISDSLIDRPQRLAEARVMMLGDYSNIKTRRWLRLEGIQFTRTQYISNLITDAFAKKQAEFAYYRQTNGGYLPNTTMLRKMQIKNIFPLR
jgi:GH24 family phage-related lysozyme (muramidase)